MQFSFWEDNFYQCQNGALIIGSGIVGLSTAIELKLQHPNLSVVVVEKYHPPQGASTKNAGFACFGSLSELMDDLQHIPEKDLKTIISMRWTGIKILQDRLAAKNVPVLFTGGHELLRPGETPEPAELAKANTIMQETLGIENYFEVKPQDDFNNFSSLKVFMRQEGELDTMQMFNALYETAVDLGVKFIFGHNVEAIDTKRKKVSFTSGLDLDFRLLFLCTNGFTRNLFPQYEVIPARNLVCVTEPIEGLKWTGVFHYDKGYYYFRRIGNRILLGGARNLDPETETTDQFEFNEQIKDELIRFLHENICPQQNVKITNWWTGILGVGPSKLPIVEQIDTDCYIGVRLGGMGVAIGSYLGKLLVEKANQSL
ncbi:MAG: FAD-binding oxidoreductase [Saprospiraceae bacterium]|nr:FAD-binding oxidoreductase [Saprospiraceae bacterium]